MHLEPDVNHGKPTGEMHRCKICNTDRLIRTQNLSCGHHFCQECLLALLPNPSNPISVLPQHIAVIVCPRCHRTCEYSQVLAVQQQTTAKKVGAADATAPHVVVHIDEAERKRRHKRAQFVQAYRRDNDGLNRKSRSRFYSLMEEDEENYGYLSRASERDGRVRSSKGVAATSVGRCEEDVRAIDHVNGRFVTCTIIPGPNDNNCKNTRNSQRPKLPSCSAHDDFYSKYTGRADKAGFVSPETNKTACLFARGKQCIVVVLLIVLFIIIVVMTSLMNSLFSKSG